MNDVTSDCGEDRFPVPGPGLAVITVWAADHRPLVQRTITLDRRVVLGRAPDHLRGADRATLVPLEQTGPPLMSRAHIVVEHVRRGGWRIRHLDVSHPGRVRYWGDLAWSDPGPDAYLRLGLIAYLFPGEPTHLLTVTAPDVRQVRAPLVDAGGIRTTEETTAGPAATVRVNVSNTQRMVLTDVLEDAVRWPPAVADGRVRGWHELGQATVRSDSPRKSYERLKAQAAQARGLGWSGGPAQGVDPVLLRRVIDVGEITYADVYRQRGAWPWGGLMPTHHTHAPNGRRRFT